MKKLFILIVNIVIAFPVFSCWGPAYTQEEHKHYLIPNLFVTHDCRYSLVATTNNLYNDIDYNIYDFDFEQLENKLLDLGIKQNTIELMNSKIVASVNSYQDGICIVFDEEYKHSKVKIYDVNINNFYPSDIVDEFIKLNQLELLNYLMYRHIILFDAKYYVFNDYNGSFFDSRYLSKEVKNRLRDLIEYQIVSTHKDLKDDYVMLLLDMNLFDANYEQVVVDYMYNLDNNIDLNVIAHSHFSGAVVKTYAVASSFNFMEYRDNNELSVYLFSKLFDHPKLYRQVLSEISFVVNDKENFDWEKCFSYCQTQEERDRINLAKVSLFSGINISLFEYFKDKTTNDSKLFELALIQYLQRVERHLLSPLCVANSFHKEYKKSSDFVNKHVLADAIDLEDYLNKIDIQNKVLLHMLRGYLAFMLGDFVKANKEYSFSSKHILTADYLSNQQKYGYRKQLEGLLILVDYHEDYSNQEYAALNTRLKKFLKETYRTEEMESYFELGLTNAVKQKDFATAFCFASSSGYHLEILLDIFMDYSDLDQLLLLIDENKLPFGERHPDFLRFAVIEQIGTKYFRDDNFIQAKKYFDMLPDYVLDEGRGGVGYFNRIPYSYNYHNIRVDYSRGQDTIVKTYNKRTVLNRVIELKSDISHYKLQLNNRSLSQHIILELRKKLSDSYFDLACIYSNPFLGIQSVLGWFVKFWYWIFFYGSFRYP